MEKFNIYMFTQSGIPVPYLNNVFCCIYTNYGVSKLYFISEENWNTFQKENPSIKNLEKCINSEKLPSGTYMLDMVHCMIEKV